MFLADVDLSDDDDAYELAETRPLNPDAYSLGSRKAPDVGNSSGSAVSTMKKTTLLSKPEKTDSKLSLRAAVQKARFLQSLDKPR